MTAEDKLTLVMLKYEYRLWRNGKEVKYQPNINRLGNWGTYGDDEKPAESPSEVVAVSYKETTLSIASGKPFAAGGLELTFTQTSAMLRLSVKSVEGVALSLSNVAGKDLSTVVNPIAVYSYSPLTPEGVGVELGDVKLIKAEGKTTKYLAVRLTADNGIPSCQLRFWAP